MLQRGFFVPGRETSMIGTVVLTVVGFLVAGLLALWDL
jgi:hypothetical protein